MLCCSKINPLRSWPVREEIQLLLMSRLVLFESQLLSSVFKCMCEWVNEMYNEKRFGYHCFCCRNTDHLPFGPGPLTFAFSIVTHSIQYQISIKHQFLVHSFEPAIKIKDCVGQKTPNSTGLVVINEQCQILWTKIWSSDTVTQQWVMDLTATFWYNSSWVMQRYVSLGEKTHISMQANMQSVTWQRKARRARGAGWRIQDQTVTAWALL